MFSVADARRFIAAALVVIMFRMMHDLPTIHMKSPSRVSERVAVRSGGTPRAGFGSGVRAHLFRFGGQGSKSNNDNLDSLDMGGNEEGMEDGAAEMAAGNGDNAVGSIASTVSGGGGGAVEVGGAYNNEGGGFAGDGGAIDDVGGVGGDTGVEENEMFDSSKREIDEAAAVHVREAANNIFIPTVPDDKDDDDSAVTSDRRPCRVTPNCTHWRDWIAMPQDVLLTHRQVRNVKRILEDTKDDDPLTTRQRFTVEVWDPRRKHNPTLPNKPMHVIPMEATFLHFLPPEDVKRKIHETCAVVGNAGTMLHSGLGPYIDAHEAVIRINYAPTRGFERDVGTKTTYDLSNKENSGKLGDGTYQWRNSTLLLSEGHSSVVRKNAYRQLVPASLGRGDSPTPGQNNNNNHPHPVRFLSMSLVSMSRFTWFAIKAELEDRINRELRVELQRSLGAKGASDALSGGLSADQMAVLQQQVLSLREEQQGGAMSLVVAGQQQTRRRAAMMRRRRLLEEEVQEDEERQAGTRDGRGGVETRRSGRRLSQSTQSAESLLASLSNMVDNVPDNMGQQIKHVGQQFKYNPKPMTGMVAVYFALQVCKKVDLYGFQAYRGRRRGAPPYHYFDRRQGMTWVHSFDLAVEAFKEMGKHHHLFLRDKENPM